MHFCIKIGPGIWFWIWIFKEIRQYVSFSSHHSSGTGRLPSTCQGIPSWRRRGCSSETTTPSGYPSTPAVIPWPRERCCSGERTAPACRPLSDRDAVCFGCSVERARLLGVRCSGRLSRGRSLEGGYPLLHLEGEVEERKNRKRELMTGLAKKKTYYDFLGGHR